MRAKARQLTALPIKYINEIPQQSANCPLEQTNKFMIREITNRKQAVGLGS